MTPKLKPVAFAALLACASAHATNYYISDCQSGAHASCVAGSDAANGTSTTTPWQTVSKAQGQFSSLNAGDALLFAQGGKWAMTTSPDLRNTNSTPGCMADGAADSRHTCAVGFDSYTPSWGGSAKPIIITSGNRAFSFNNSGSTPNGGYYLSNLDIRASASGGGEYGISIGRPLNGLNMVGLNLQDFDVGFNCYDGSTLTDTGNYHSHNIHLKRSTITRNVTQGALWGCNGLIEKNVFTYNGQGNIFDHQLYVGAHWDGPGFANTRSNLIIRFNDFLENGGLTPGATCPSVVIVGHGVWHTLEISNNRIIQASGAADGACYGIAIDNGYDTGGGSGPESFTNVRIVGNLLVNLGGIGIGCASCVNPVIENNEIIHQHNVPMWGIAVPDRAAQAGDGDAVDTGGTIRNNTIDFQFVPNGAFGIKLQAFSLNAGTNLNVTGNIIKFAATSNTRTCFDTTGISAGSFTNFSHNLCYDVNGGATWDARGTPIDTNRLTTDPLFVSTPTTPDFSTAVQVTSPAVDSSSTTFSASRDRRGCIRDATPDRGAREYFSSPCVVPAAAAVGVR